MRISYTSLGAVSTLLAAPDMSKLQRRLCSRLRAKYSVSGNKTFGGLKKPEEKHKAVHGSDRVVGNVKNWGV